MNGLQATELHSHVVQITQTQNHAILIEVRREFQLEKGRQLGWFQLFKPFNRFAPFKPSFGRTRSSRAASRAIAVLSSRSENVIVQAVQSLRSAQPSVGKTRPSWAARFKVQKFKVGLGSRFGFKVELKTSFAGYRKKSAHFAPLVFTF